MGSVLCIWNMWNSGNAYLQLPREEPNLEMVDDIKGMDKL